MPISHKHSAFVYPEYISPLPADELIRVGTIKQQLYNEGVAKVQNQIDTLDQYGLSILKEEDKRYFSQEMDKFMKAINEGAAKTDFTNINSLKNLLSVGRPLEADPLIMNALQSTQEIQRRQQTLASLDPEDRDPANDYYFMQDVEDYLKDGKVGSKLGNREYIPYVDPTEYMSDTLENVKADITSDIVKNNGYLNKIEVEELTNEKLKQWMETNLPTKIRQQIQLDAMYTTKDIDRNQMVKHYVDTRTMQYNQTMEMIQKYEANKKYLDDQDIKDYKRLQRTAAVLKNNLENLPNSPETAYNAWVNDHYNSYLTGQADLYAYRKEKKSIEADPFSLASYHSNLRKKEEYYKNITLPEEMIARRLMTPEYDDSNSKISIDEQISRATTLNNQFPKFTNNRTVSKTYQKLQVSRMDEEDKKLMKKALRDALIAYADTKGDVKLEDIPDEIDLSKVEVRQNEDETYVYRIETGVDKSGWFTGDVVYEVLQDKFDDALRKNLDLDKVDFQDSVNSRFTRNTPVTSSGAPAVDSALSGRDTTSDSTYVRSVTDLNRFKDSTILNP
jgi:hypothetical protein